MLVSLLLLCALAIIRFCPETPAAIALQRFMVDGPARFLSRLTLRKALFSAAVFVVLLALGAVFPPDLAMLAAIDTATWLEVLATVSLLAAGLRLKSAFRALAWLVQRPARWTIGRAAMATARLRSRARRVRTASRLPDSGDRDPDPAFAFA
jgi:hypothetical protein